MSNAESSKRMSLQKLCDKPNRYDNVNQVSAMGYRPQADDIFVAGFPCSGTTWTIHTVALLLRNGIPPTSLAELLSCVYHLDFSGAEAVQNMKRPAVIRTHLPHHLAPWSDDAKYIYVARNPKDCSVSHHHHLIEEGKTDSFDDYFEKFLSGDAYFEDYFDHLMGWYEQREKPNVLFITYEYMKENQIEAILKIASFIDDVKYAKPLREDREKINNILKYSSFDGIKKFFQKVDIEKFDPKFVEDQVSQGMQKEMLQFCEKLKSIKMANFLRKGIVGDWRSHFTEDQNKRMNEKLENRIKGTDLYKLWKVYI